MGDEGPGDAEHPGITGERPDRELGELAVVSGRQVQMNLMDLPFHEMIVVDEPFRRGRYRATLIDRSYRGSIRVDQHPSVIDQPPRQKVPLVCSGRHDLCDRKTTRMVLQAFNAEKFFANGILAIPRGRKTRALKGAPREKFQFRLSASGSCAEENRRRSHLRFAARIVSSRPPRLTAGQKGLYRLSLEE